jgi:ribosome biogenesis protein ENP2
VKAKYNEEAKNFTQLIEHFEFPIATTQLALCPDQKHLWCSGIYPPQVHCYELDQLTMKFSRHIELEVIRMVPLSNDFRKIVLMGQDRNLEIHAGFGAYDNFKIPKQGRDMIFHHGSAELMMVGSGPSMYRFDFEVGMFKKPYDTVTETEAINSIKMNGYHELIALGCDNGYVECIDHRARRHVGILKAAENIQLDFSVDTGMEITALQFDRDGTNLAIGTAKGQVALFDTQRSSL